MNMKYDLYIEFKVFVNFSKGHLQENILIFTSVYPLSVKVHKDNLYILIKDVCRPIFMTN